MSKAAALQQQSQEYLQKGIQWYQKREPRERNLITLGVVIAAFMLVYTTIESVIGLFSAQSARYAELESSLERIPPLLHRYNAVKRKKELIDKRFLGANAQQAANYAHLEQLIKRKAQITSRFDIKKREEIEVRNEYLVVPFSVSFSQLSAEELSNFLRELSQDKERPSLISLLEITTRGSKLKVDMNLEFISQAKTT